MNTLDAFIALTRVLSSETRDMSDMSPKRLVIASVIYPGRTSELNALLFVESIREFAGNLSQTPVWCYVPENKEQLSSKVKDRLLELDILLIPFKETRDSPA